MLSTANPQKEAQMETSPERKRFRSVLSSALGFVLWSLGLLILVIASWIVHSHPGPWPTELAFSRWAQGLSLPSWLHAILVFVSTFNDPLPSGIALAVLMGFMLFNRWFRPALFLGLLVLVGDSIDAIIGDLVGRPRPSPHLIHVSYSMDFNSFPSGHTEHIVIFYGFLLFLSFTKPVRQWRYAKWLIPLQILAFFDVLAMGFSRVLEGEHWPADVLAAYLSGLLWLTLFMYLYGLRWTRNDPGAWERAKLATRGK